MAKDRMSPVKYHETSIIGFFITGSLFSVLKHVTYTKENYIKLGNRVRI